MLPVSMNSRVALYATSSLLTLALLQQLWSSLARSKKKYPPSPWSLPILGNLLSIPSDMEHIAFTKLSKQLNSDIIYLRMFGYDFVVLTSEQVATDLLEKRSRLYSDRLSPSMLKEPSLMNWGSNISLLGYNDHWRHQRRMLNNWLNARAATQFNQLQEYQARLMLQRLINVVGDPHPFEKVKHALFRNAASSTLQLAYGYILREDNDPVFHDLNQLAHVGAFAAMFTSEYLSDSKPDFFVNIFPSLIYVPDWFPGTGWKRTAREWRALKERAHTTPYEWTKAQLAAGTAKPSILSMLLQDHNLTSDLSTAEKEYRLKELASMIVLAGTDTTATMMVAFLAAMVLNPHVQEKAQKEIDNILGPMSLPTLADRERLPYVWSVVQEVLRWQPAAPIGIPHLCRQDDAYQEYDIKGGSIVIGNIWAMTRNESVYKDPDVFNPDRFLDPNVPYAPAFGWGRRKCPGIYFAEASLFITATSLLAAFKLLKKKDSDGKDIVPQLEVISNATVAELKPFEFELELRSDKHRDLIMEQNSM